MHTVYFSLFSLGRSENELVYVSCLFAKGISCSQGCLFSLPIDPLFIIWLGFEISLKGIPI